MRVSAKSRSRVEEAVGGTQAAGRPRWSTRLDRWRIEQLRRAQSWGLGAPWWRWLGAAASLGLVPLLSRDDTVLQYADLALIYGIAVCGLDVQQGFAGVVNLGPGAAVGVGAYTVAVVSHHLHWPMPLPFAALLAVLLPVAVIFGGAAVTLSRFHFTMLSFYSALLVPVVAGHGGWLTGGDTGLSDVEPLQFGGWRPQGVALYLVLAVVLVVAFVLFTHLAHGRWGRAWVALADDELGAQAAGIAPRPTIFGAVVVGTLFALVAGGLFVSAWPGNCLPGVPCVIGPNYFGFSLSVLLFAAVVIGGAGSRLGPLAAAVLLVALSWFFDTHDTVPGNWQEVIYGGLLVVAVVALPRGLASVGRLLEIASPPSPPQPVVTPVLPPRARGGAAVTVRGLRVRFGGVVALDGVDLEVPRGEVHALIGPNGSGKTTVINCIAGVVRPLEGEVWLDDERLAPVPPHRAYVRARRGIHRTFQTPRVQARLGVVENVMQGVFRLPPAGKRHRRRPADGRRWAGAAEAQRRRRAVVFVGAVGLGHRIGDRAAVLPHGERRLLEVARALVGEPVAVLLDEPAAGLGPEERRALAAVLRACRDWGCAVLLVEHDLDLVLDVADRVTVLDHGRVVCRGTPATVRADPAVAEVFMGPLS